MSKIIYAIIGPTASGKTSLSLELAKKLDGEVISVDSRQIYYGMDIGTAKEASRPDFPFSDYHDIWKTPFLIENIPHYLIDICLPTDTYTAFDFKEQAKFLIEDMFERGKTPILAGGTGLYFSTLLFDYQPGEETTELKIYKELEKRYQAGEKLQLWNELKEVDPESAESIHPNNSRYLLRALEYFKVTGTPKSRAQQKASTPIYDVKFIGIDWTREDLYKRINQRIDIQLANGLLDEVKDLTNKYSLDLPAMSSLGYLELGSYLRSELSFDKAVELFKQNTRRYAKRQLTWFRKYNDVEWRKPS